MTPFLVYILKVALLTAVFVLLYHLLLRRDTFHRTARIVLVSSLIVSYILPLCVITIHKPAPVVENRDITFVQTPAPAVLSAAIDSYQDLPVLQQVQAQPQAFATADVNSWQIDWMVMATVVYAFGAVILIILRLLAVKKVFGIIRRGQVAIERDGCKIVISKDNVRPFSWMNYIVLPEDYSEQSCASAVIRHEYSHISHHHSIELLAIDILSAFQWFNPAVWLLRHDLCCVQEFQADASVLESGVARAEYEESLLNMVTGGISIPLVNGLGESSLRTRIKMMNRRLSCRVNLLKLIYLPVVLIVALVLMSNTVYDTAVNTSASPVNDVPALEEPMAFDESVISDEITVSDGILSDNEPADTDIEESLDVDEPETAQILSARFDDSYLTTQVAIPSFQDNSELSHGFPEIMLDSLKKQYPELNSIESIYDDRILTNDKPYKGYISCIQLSKGVYSFWVMGLEDKAGQVVSIELGTIDDAMAFLENLVSSYKQGNAVFDHGHTFTAIKGNVYSIPRTDGVEPDPYLISVKNLKHDLSVLEKRKNWGTTAFDEIGFYTMENKPDHYEVLYPNNPITYESLEINSWSGDDGGEGWARTELEKRIREKGGEGHIPGKPEWIRPKFNGVILLSFQKNEYMTASGAYKEYIQFYIPINYDQEKYQAPLTEYQRSLKRRVFRRNK